MAGKSTLYDTDFYAWSNQQAALLRAGELNRADLEHIAEEIESIGRAEKRELVSRLTVLLLPLLRWQCQPGGRGSSWQASIRVQRNRLTDHLDDNPSLKPLIPDAIGKAYRDAIVEASVETKLSETIFAPACPWSLAGIAGSKDEQSLRRTRFVNYAASAIPFGLQPCSLSTASAGPISRSSTS